MANIWQVQRFIDIFPKQIKILVVFLVINGILFLPVFRANPELKIAFILGTVVIRIILISVMLTILVQLIMRYRSDRVVSLFLYMMVLVLLLNNYYLEFYGILLANTEFMATAKVLYQIGVLTLLLAPIPLLYFVSTYTTNFIKYYQAFPIIIAVGMFIDEVFSDNIISVHTEIIDGFNFSLFILSRNAPWFIYGWMMSLVYSGCMLIYMTMKIKYKNNSSRIRKQQLTVLSGIVLIFFLSPLSFLIDPFPDNIVLKFYWANIVVNSILVLGIAFLSYPYVMQKGINSLQPQPYENLLIADTGGSLIYSFNFETLDTNPFIEYTELFTASFSAISTLMHETLGIEANITKIEFRDNLIYSVNHRNVTFLLFVEYETMYIQSRMASFVNNFFDFFGDGADSLELQNKQMQTTLNNLVKTSFGF